MVTLRARMQAHLVNWRDDLDAEWTAFFADCPAPDFAAIPEDIQVADDTLVWPGRRIEEHPEAPAGSHICRAFDGIAPQDVRVVVLGQDPYPAIGRATGRAFEDGAWEGQTQTLASSLKGLTLAALATREGHEGLFQAGQWPEIRRQIQFESLAFPALADYFNALAGRGVLFVNSAWTYTRPEDILVHLDLWKSTQKHFLSKLAVQDQPVVFLVLGEEAMKTLCDAEPLYNRSIVVMHAHPRAPQFLSSRNPLERVNLALERLDADRVQWWPPQTAA